MITKLHQQLAGHEDRVWQIAWNPVKPLIASCSSDKTVRMYACPLQASDPKFVHATTISTGHAKSVRSLAWAPSGSTLATGSFDSQIAIWEQDIPQDDDLELGPTTIHDAEWECMSSLEGHETECKSVAYSCTGTLLASCSRDKTVWVWEVRPDTEFEVLSVLMEHTQDVKFVSWHPTKEILASASYDDTIKLYADDPDEDWFSFATLKGHTSTVWSLAWSPDGIYLASASEDLTIRIWAKLTESVWETVLVLRGHTRSIFSISWGKGKGGDDSLGWLASTGSDGQIFVWNILKPVATPDKPESIRIPSSELLVNSQNAHGVHDVNCIAWCPWPGFETTLATGGDDGMVNIWKISEST